MIHFDKDQRTGREHTRVPAADNRQIHISVCRGRVSLGTSVLEAGQVDELVKALEAAGIIAAEQIAVAERASWPADAEGEPTRLGFGGAR
jgi:hypothetical protein